MTIRHHAPIRFLVIAVLLLASSIHPVAGQNTATQDSIELLNGTKLTGRILEIRKAEKEFDFRLNVAGREVTQTIDYSRVHAATYNGKRFVINPLKIDSADGVASGESTTRSAAEVRKLIDTVGASEPDWLAATDMNHPQTLVLDWPLKEEGPWDESKNVGQYIWGRVNPNPGRWRSGIKLIYECMELHQGNAQLLRRDMEKLGVMYFQLLQDYPRAAFWLQKANVKPNTEAGVHLAECYWRLGNEKMALDALNSRQLHLSAIKLYGDIGNISKAMQLTKAYESTAVCNEAWLNAGDALRNAGRFPEAMAQYQKVLDRNQARNAEYLARYKGRASDSIESIRLMELADVSRVASGSYRATATGYNGPLEVEVKVLDAKITEVRVTQHTEKQFYAALTDTPQQIIARQGFQDIDGTSGATITSQAIVSATAKALAKGAR